MGLIAGYKYLKDLKLGDKFCLKNNNEIKTFIKYEATNYNYRENSWHDSHYDYDEASCDVLIYTKEDKKPIKVKIEDSSLKYGWGRKQDKEKFHEMAGEYVIKDALFDTHITWDSPNIEFKRDLPNDYKVLLNNHIVHLKTLYNYGHQCKEIYLYDTSGNRLCHLESKFPLEYEFFNNLKLEVFTTNGK